MVFYDDLSFENIKENYKKANCTLNDYLIGVLSKTLKEYFQLKDPSKVYTNVTVGFPMNLRYSFPKTHKEVVLENNIAAADLNIPLISDVKEETKKISKLTSSIKSSGEYFAIALFLKIGVMLMPKKLMAPVNTFITSKVTICLSNIPFFRNTLTLQDMKSTLIQEVGFLNNNSDIGVAVCVLTYGTKVSISVVADTARLENPDELAVIYKNNLLANY